MTRERIYFEASSLKEHGRWCGEHVPQVYHFDRTMSVIAMRYLEPPHMVLRKGLIAAVEYPLLAHHMSDYMSRTLFFNSILYHSTTHHKLGGKFTTHAISLLSVYQHLSSFVYFYDFNLLKFGGLNTILIVLLFKTSILSIVFSIFVYLVFCTLKTSALVVLLKSNFSFSFYLIYFRHNFSMNLY